MAGEWLTAAVNTNMCDVILCHLIAKKLIILLHQLIERLSPDWSWLLVSRSLGSHMRWRRCLRWSRRQCSRGCAWWSAGRPELATASSLPVCALHSWLLLLSSVFASCAVIGVYAAENFKCCTVRAVRTHRGLDLEPVFGARRASEALPRRAPLRNAASAGDARVRLERSARADANYSALRHYTFRPLRHTRAAHSLDCSH